MQQLIKCINFFVFVFVDSSLNTHTHIQTRSTNVRTRLFLAVGQSLGRRLGRKLLLEGNELGGTGNVLAQGLGDFDTL